MAGVLNVVCWVFSPQAFFFFSVSCLLLKVKIKIIYLNLDKIKLLHSRKCFHLLEVYSLEQG